MFGGATAPSGWLICDGSTYSSAVYPTLFSVIGYLYGGAGSNFQVPDFQTRTPVGSITGASAPSPAVMTLPNNGSSSVFVIIQLGTTAVTTTPLNVIVPGCVFTAGAFGPYTVLEMIYADYGRNVYLCKLNATLGGGGQTYTGTITFPKSSVASPNTTLPYQPGFIAPAYYAPSLAPNQLPPHVHNYNVQQGGLTTTTVINAQPGLGNPNVVYQVNPTTQTSPSSGGPGFDTTSFQFPAGLIGPQPVVALGVQPIPSVSINYLIKV
jgi:microcystin-dependent protein